MENQWEAELAGLLSELSATQDSVLELLSEKRQLLVKNDLPGLQAMQPREQELIARLQGCHDRRGQLLGKAAEQGLPSDSIRSLAAVVPLANRQDFSKQVQQAAGRSRLLQHQSLTNWVVVQRTLIHLSQMLEIIATGGRERPTYSKGESGNTTGSLVDRAA